MESLLQMQTVIIAEQSLAVIVRLLQVRLQLLLHRLQQAHVPHEQKEVVMIWEMKDAAESELKPVNPMEPEERNAIKLMVQIKTLTVLIRK